MMTPPTMQATTTTKITQWQPPRPERAVDQGAGPEVVVVADQLFLAEAVAQSSDPATSIATKTRRKTQTQRMTTTTTTTAQTPMPTQPPSSRSATRGCAASASS